MKENFLVVALGFVGMICLGYGLIASLAPKAAEKDILFEAAADSRVVMKTTVSPESEKEITIDIEGAVQKPGVYSLPANSRVQDALISAGGLSAKADRAKVSKSLNLAAKLIDGAKIYIPQEGESAEANSNASGGETVLGGETNELVHINTASESELDTLPGVGPATAAKIINGRPYSSIEELTQKKIVGSSIFGKIKNKIGL